jgi:hypothetical protein
MDYSNLLVTAHLRAPVVADCWLPLDGILFYQHVRADLGAQEMTVPGQSAQPKGAPIKGGRLPIAIVHDKHWYYRCSWAHWGPHVDGQDHWVKRFDNGFADLVDFHGRRGRVDTSAAAYRAYHMPVNYRSALYVQWYCVADYDCLAPLLAAVTHIGKKAAQGWGRVSLWEVERMDCDRSIWDGEQRLMRGIPVYHARGGEPRGIYGIKPPYWDRRNQMELAMPGGKDAVA